MKLLFCIDHLRGDGTQRVLCQLVQGLARRGHRIAVLCLNDSWDEAVIGELRAAGAQVKVAGKAALLGGYGIPGLLAWIRQWRPEVAVTMLFAADVLGRALARGAGVPRVVSSIRARNIDYKLWQLLLVRFTAPLSDAVIVNGRGTLAYAALTAGARPEGLVYIPNGVDVAAYQAPICPAALRAELGIAPTARLVGSVGRLTRQKGHDLLIDALAEPGLDDVHLLLAGVGEEQGRLQAQIEARGLAARAHFAGYRRDIPRILGALDVYAHPARFEGMPNALLEAMAAGCPVVASAIDGNADLIEDGHHGWLVPPDEPPALAAALRAALDYPAEARRRGAAARERAMCRYSLEAMVVAWEEVLYGRP
jgi:glycosyltransferase involved in cell wall biosynthesis